MLATRKLVPQTLKVGTVQVRDGDALAYIATYLVLFAPLARSLFGPPGAPKIR